MNRRLAVFDVDGTIAEKNVIPETIIDGFRHIQSLGYLTTVSTGRAYQRFRDAFADSFDALISDEALMIVEHGTKVVRKGGEVVQADYFTRKEVDHFVDFIQANADMIHFASYAPPDPAKRMQIWVKDPTELEAITAKRTYADVFHCSYEELKEHIAGHTITHAVAKLQEFIVVQNLRLHFTRSDMDLILMDGYMQFVGNLSDKSKALTQVEERLGIPMSDMLVAGNGINDVDMLNHRAGQRILVGDGDTTPMIFAQLERQEQIVRIDSPEALGTYLKNLS